jgi:hypothetical protein
VHVRTRGVVGGPTAYIPITISAQDHPNKHLGSYRVAILRLTDLSTIILSSCHPYCIKQSDVLLVVSKCHVTIAFGNGDSHAIFIRKF